MSNLCGLIGTLVTQWSLLLTKVGWRMMLRMCASCLNGRYSAITKVWLSFCSTLWIPPLSVERHNGGEGWGRKWLTVKNCLNTLTHLSHPTHSLVLLPYMILHFVFRTCINSSNKFVNQWLTDLSTTHIIRHNPLCMVACGVVIQQSHLTHHIL